VRKVMDIVDNRVEANLQAIQHTLLVELPADRCVLRTEATCIATCPDYVGHMRACMYRPPMCSPCVFPDSQLHLACRDSKVCCKLEAALHYIAVHGVLLQVFHL
jgi:hypothetical protein